MAGTRKVISFFLASPGDLIEERRVVKDVAEELNSMLANKLSVQIELVGWEDTVSSVGRPQEIINRDLERCDVFIGLVWKRWGTPPDTENRFASGFEEEFYQAIEGYTSSKRPQISLFFKDVDRNLINDPGEQLQKVIKFKKSITSEKKILYQTFSVKEDLERIIRKCILNYVLEHLDFISPTVQEASAPIQDKSEADFTTSPFPPLSAEFLNNLLKRTGGDEKKAQLQPFEVARFRLMSSTLGDGYNDNSYIGAHDANLLLKHRSDCKFEFNEVAALVLAGAKNLKNENTPFWSWLKHPGFRPMSLNMVTLLLPKEEAATKGVVIDLMTSTNTQIEVDEFFVRELYLDSWLSSDSKVATQNPALKYLSVLGKNEDLPIIEKIIEENNSQTISAAHEAYISIKLRDGAEIALQAVHQLQPASLSLELVSRIFKQPGTISDQALRGALENRNKLVRCKALEILIARRLILLQQAETLRQDQDLDVRHLALLALAAHEVHVSEGEAKSTFMVNVEKPSKEEQAAWEKYHPIILSSMSDTELLHRSALEAPLNIAYLVEYTKRNIDKVRAEVTFDIKDGYERFYEASIAKWANSRNKPEQSVAGLSTLKQFMINRLKREMLSALISAGSKKDLFIIRHGLSDTTLTPIEPDIEYFWTAGEWQDISLVVALVQRIRSATTSGLLGLDTSTSSAVKTAIRTIVKLSKGRAGELLDMEIPVSLKKHLISSLSDNDFLSLGSDRIKGLLRDDDGDIRKHSSLKCCKSLTKKKLKEVYDEHIGSEPVYYNTTHWLDFGMSCTKEQIKSLCSESFI